VTLETESEIQVTTLPPEMITEVRKVKNQPRQLVLKANFAAGPIELSKMLKEVTEFFEREALIYTKGDTTKVSKILKD